MNAHALCLHPMMARTHPAAAGVLKHVRLHLLRRLVSPFVVSSPAILRATWITALLAVCLALCIIHSRKPPSSSSSSSSKAASREHGASSSTRRRSGLGDEGRSGGDGVGGSSKGAASAAAATPPAKVSPTPSDAAKANGRDSETPAAAEGRGAGHPHAVQDGGGAVPVTVIDVGTHGPIAPVFPATDPLPPRRSLSVKHKRLAERLGARIRSTRWGRDDHDHDNDDDEEDAGGGPGSDPAAAEGSATLWTKTIILGERCRVGDDEDGDGDAVVRWKSYRPRQPRSVPMTRSNSFAGVGSLQLQGGGASRPADAPFHLGRRASLPAKDEM